jgi:hypothetical protein
VHLLDLPRGRLLHALRHTCPLSLERHGARTLENLRARIATRLLALAACVWLNHQLGRPSRSLVAYVA